MSGAETGYVGRREIAWRLFAQEFDDATLDYSDSDEERAPNYVITPTGARVNRVIAIGVLTEVESVSDDVLRARVVDPTGAFVVYAGQYQPEAATFLERATPPMYVAVTGKARTFTPEGSDRVFTSIRPESITEVDAATRDRWTVQAAAHTIDRVAAVAAALDRDERGESLVAVLDRAGLAPGLASGIPLAIEHYGTGPAYLGDLRRSALEALRVVTGDLEEVTPTDTAPADPGTADSDIGRPEGSVVDEAAIEAIGSVEAAAPSPRTPEPSTEADAGAADPTGRTEPDDNSATEAVAAEPSPTGEDDVTPAPTDRAPDVDDGSEGEAAAVADDESESPGAAPGEAGDDELYEIDEDERAEIESEYGTEFSAGSEVAAPGEAGIEPEAGRPAAGDSPAATPGEDAVGDGDVDAPPQEDGGGGGSGADAMAEDVDLEAAVVEAMRELDEGDGAGHDEVVETVAGEYGVDGAAVADAIQDALMSGKCYEPGDDRLKAI